MYYLMLIGIMVFSVTGMACPDITGEWTCAGAAGEKWTESIVASQEKIEVTYDKGSREEKTETIYPDGREVGEGVSAAGQAGALLASMSEFTLKLVPKEKQSMLRFGLDAIKGKLSDVFKVKGAYVCEGEVLKGRFNTTGTLSMPAVIVAVGALDSELTEQIENGERHGTLKSTGLLSSTSTSQKVDDTLTWTCVKK